MGALRAAQGAGMSREDIVAIASRLFAVFLALGVVRHLGTLIMTARTHDMFGYWAAVLALPPLLAAALLWRYPLAVARKLLPVMKAPAAPLDARSQTALELALTAIGVWLLAQGLVAASYWATFLLHPGEALRAHPPLGPSQRADIVATLVELALGAWLVAGSRGLGRALRRLRGRPETPASEP